VPQRPVDGGLRRLLATTFVLVGVGAAGRGAGPAQRRAQPDHGQVLVGVFVLGGGNVTVAPEGPVRAVVVLEMAR
jgi:hypothetical protein